MKVLTLTAMLTAITFGSSYAADRGNLHEADLAAKSAQVEALRARASLSPSSTTASTLIEAENLLRQLREAKPDKRDALSAQLNAALARLELEIDTAGRSR